MAEKPSTVYFYEVDYLLGGEALSVYDLVSLASSDFKWNHFSQEEILEFQKAV